MTEEMEMTKKMAESYNRHKKSSEDCFALINKMAKSMKLGVFGEDSYVPSAPYYLGFQGQNIALYRNDFYNRAVSTIAL
jgi:hypothetical protein